MMKIRLIAWTLAALLAVSLTGCGSSGSSPDQPENSPDSAALLYSNLADDASREETAAVLSAQGASSDRVEQFLSRVEDYNSRVSSPLAEGFVPMETQPVDYSSTVLEIREDEDGVYIPEANCRLTAFLLLGDHIQTAGAPDETDTYLMFDLDAIDTQEDFSMTAEERSAFTTLFNAVPLSGASTLAEHLALIQQAWADRGISVEGPLSLITVYLHSTFDDVRFVGHAGVLAETDQGLLFVEKYSSESPYQATWFQDRDQLKAYLLSRPDLYGEEEELEPLILENGQPLA